MGEWKPVQLLAKVVLETRLLYKDQQRLVCPEGRSKWAELELVPSLRRSGMDGNIAHVPSNGTLII